MTVFIGLDLAWTAGRETGVCVIEGRGRGAHLVELGTRIESPRAFASLCERYGPDVAVAVDAPLIVSDARLAEADLGTVFGRFKAGAYSARPAFLAKMRGCAGPATARALRSAGFTLDPVALANPGRRAFEAYPHAAHIVFFGLPERLAYKKGKVESRRVALREYQHHLRDLLRLLVPGVLYVPAVLDVLEPEATGASGANLKRLEDTLDAITCACIAIHCASGRNPGYEVFGCRDHGYIVVPGPIPSGGGRRPCATCAPALPSP
jgi:predicted RNase H-like nuclease